MFLCWELTFATARNNTLYVYAGSNSKVHANGRAPPASSPNFGSSRSVVFETSYPVGIRNVIRSPPRPTCHSGREDVTGGPKGAPNNNVAINAFSPQDSDALSPTPRSMAAQFTPTFKTFAIAGVGRFGSHLVEALVAAHPSTQVHVLTRGDKHKGDSRWESHSQITIHPHVDYTVDNLSQLLKRISAEVVITTFGAPSIKGQAVVVEAAKEAGCVKVFVPSEFGTPSDGISLGNDDEQGMSAEKMKIAKKVQDAGLPCLRIYVSGGTLYILHLVIVPSAPQIQVVRFPLCIPLNPHMELGCIELHCAYTHSMLSFGLCIPLHPRRVCHDVLLNLPEVGVSAQVAS